MGKLLTLQIIAHFLADFFCQTEKLCKKKDEIFFSKEHLIHLAIVIFFSFALSFSFSFWWAALIIGVSHFLIDNAKSYLIKKDCWQRRLFFIDQPLHFFIIGIFTFCFVKNNVDFSLNNVCTKTIFDVLSALFSVKTVAFFCSTKGLLVILSFIFCLKPANVFIKKFLDTFEIDITKNNSDQSSSLEKAGRVIGSLERVLTFTLILFGQYEAVGFIIAAKSILRFRDTDEKAEAKTEYLLIGSLMSFGIAILLGIFCKEIIS